MIDAFILTLRFFIQNNELTSFANIEKLFSALPVEPARITTVIHSRKVINNYLDQGSYTVVSERLTRRYIFEVFLWGGLAHANRKQKEVDDAWATLPLFLCLHLGFTAVLVELLRAIFWFRLASKEAVAILESQTSKSLTA